MEEVKNQKVWIFHIGTQEGINILIYINNGVQQQDRKDSQNLNNDSFCRLTVVSCQDFIGTKKYSDIGILLIYNNATYFQGYGQIKEAFRTLTKDDVPKPYISEHDFRPSIEGNPIGFILYVFDIRYQKTVKTSQSITVKFKFDRVAPENVNGYALVFTNKLKSVSSDGQCYFNLY